MYPTVSTGERGSCRAWHWFGRSFALPVQTPLALVIVFLTMACSCEVGIAQVTHEKMHAAISSDAFLRGLPPGSLPTEPSLPTFPPGIVRSLESDSPQQATQAAFSPNVQRHSSNTVTTAQFESPEIASTASPTIGSGVAIPPQQLVPPTLPTPQTQLVTKSIGWHDRLGLDPMLPNFCVGYETLGFRRGNDSVGPYSHGEGLNRFDQDVSGRYTVSRLHGKMDRLEFKFTGPFHWDRQSTSIGPVNSNLPPTIATSFDGADRHQQFHGVRLSSYELNRCWSGDELSMIYCGLRVLDHEERYRLESTKGVSISSFQLETENLLAGGQMGMNLFRPISQRLTTGFATAIGLYGNFASGSLNATDGATRLVGASESVLRLNSMFEMSGLLNYRISQNIIATLGYEWWYFPALATPADQRLAYNSQLSQFSIRTGDDQLFRGWSVGLSARF